MQFVYGYRVRYVHVYVCVPVPRGYGPSYDYTFCSVDYVHIRYTHHAFWIIRTHVHRAVPRLRVCVTAAVVRSLRFDYHVAFSSVGSSRLRARTVLQLDFTHARGYFTFVCRVP